MEENLTNSDQTTTETSNPISQRNIERPLKGGWPVLSEYFNRHQKLVTYVAGGIIVLILGIIAYRYFIIEPQEQQAKIALTKNLRYFENDSFALAIRGNGVEPGLQEIADDYGMTKSGNLAKYLTGMSLMHLGKYEEAISYLEDFNTKSIIIKPIALGAIGDAYSQLKKYDEAAKNYLKAAEASDNKYTSPRFYFKAGLVNEKLADYKQALSNYKKIKENYPTSDEAREIDKYIARAQAGVDTK